MPDPKHHEHPGPLPGRQTEVPNAGKDFDAQRDLQMTQGARDRIREVDLPKRRAQTTNSRNLSGPRGENQESRGRGSRRS